MEPAAHRRTRRDEALLDDEEGLSTVEYIIILILIAIIGIAAWRQFGQAVQTQANSATGSIQGLGS